MRALITLITALSLPIGILNLFGGVTAGVWLAILGEWRLIGVGLLLLVSSHFLIEFALMPGLILAAPAVKAIESGRTTLAALFGNLSLIYTTVIVVAWSYLMLRIFYGQATDSSQIPLLLWSYGAATAPWAYMAAKDQKAQDGENPSSVFALFFLSLGYICCMLALLFWSVSAASCLWILAAFMTMSYIISAVVAFLEMREEARCGS